MVSVVYRVALVATLVVLTALLVGHHPPAYAQEAPPAPMVEGFPVAQGEDQEQNLQSRISKSQSLKGVQQRTSLRT